MEQLLSLSTRSRVHETPAAWEHMEHSRWSNCTPRVHGSAALPKNVQQVLSRSKWSSAHAAHMCSVSNCSMCSTSAGLCAPRKQLLYGMECVNSATGKLHNLHVECASAVNCDMVAANSHRFDSITDTKLLKVSFQLVARLEEIEPQSVDVRIRSTTVHAANKSFNASEIVRIKFRLRTKLAEDLDELIVVLQQL